jgi:hypothetical protein
VAATRADPLTDQGVATAGPARGRALARKKVSPGWTGADLHLLWWAILGLNQ